MKANELQIGDYFMLNGSVVIVEEISAKGWVHITDPETGCRIGMTSDYILSELKPIPLTDEIIERNGFIRYNHNEAEKVHMVVKYGNYKRITRQNEESLIDCLEIIYIHELQHVLRLMGVEKEIKP